jgi:hypothetical protein
MSIKLFGVLLAVMISSTSIFAMQGRGGRGGGTPVGGPAIPSNSGAQGNRPPSPGAGAAQRPANPGKPESPAADHKPDASAHAVDPTDTHGFKNYGEYVAANQVSENLGIPLTDLKGAMDSHGGSLGKAIQTLRPELNPKQINAEIKKAEAASKKAQVKAKKSQS